jgi:hypothetical protein
MRFYCATTLRNGPVDLLPHWLKHYLRLGVDQIVLCVLREGMEAQLDQIHAAIAGLPVRVHLFSDWTDERQQQVLRNSLDDIGCRGEDWVVHADLDELNEFPCPIDELALAMEKAGRTAVHGNFIDRVSVDGRFVAAQPTPSLAEQYPIECQLTDRILQGFTEKIMLARHEVWISGGHHKAGAFSGGHVIGQWQDYRVHHFKWRAGVLERLRWALANVASADSQWGRETGRLLEFVGSGGRIPVEDPRLESRLVGSAAPKIYTRSDGGLVLEKP